ncbi:MAG: translation initiation factor IF-2 [Desulfovibrio sp.]|nr:translation initiation factor IF-2 [Desulfovibrio sp.]
MNKKVLNHQERQYAKPFTGDGKLHFISALTTFVRGHLLLFGTLLVLFFLSLSGYSGWRYYQYRQSGIFAFAKFSAALTPPNAETLAKRVDFNTLSGHLAQAIAADYPFFKEGPNQLRDIKDLIQMNLLRRVMTKEEPAKEKPDPQKNLLSPLAVFPDDFLTQFTKNLVIQDSQDSAKDGPVFLSSSVEHPLLEQAFPILLRMEKIGGVWIIRDVANAEELVNQFRAAQLKRMKARLDARLAKREAAGKRMNSIIALKSCSAGTTKLSDGKTLLLVTNVLGRNISSLTVNNTNLEVVFNAGDKELLRRYLNASQPVRPGEDFNQHWNIEFDLQSGDGQDIWKTSAISCSPSWRSMGLANGEVLYYADLPEMEEDFK